MLRLDNQMILQDNTTPIHTEGQNEPWVDFSNEVNPQMELTRQLFELKRELKEIRRENRELYAWTDTVLQLGWANDMVGKIELIPRRNEPARVGNIMKDAQ